MRFSLTRSLWGSIGLSQQLLASGNSSSPTFLNTQKALPRLDIHPVSSGDNPQIRGLLARYSTQGKSAPARIEAFGLKTKSRLENDVARVEDALERFALASQRHFA